MSSLCSGSGAGELALNAIAQASSSVFNVPVHARTPFCCESEPWNQQHLMQLLGSLGGRIFCVFDDVVSLGRGDGSARCVVHGNVTKGG